MLFILVQSVEAQAFIRIADDATFELAPIPEGYRVLSAPSCISKSELERYPDTLTRLSERVSCANVRMNAKMYEEQIAAMDESLQVIQTNSTLLKKSLEKLNQKKKLEDLGEGVMMPVGERTNRYHTGAVFEARCAVSPGTQFGNGEPIGTLNSKFRKTDPIFTASTPALQKTLTQELPKLFSTLGGLIAEEKPSKVKIGYYATQVVFALSPFVTVGREFFDEAFPGQKPALTTQLTVSNEKKCKKAGDKFFVIRFGTAELKACFNPGDVPIAGDLVKAAKKEITERLTALEKERIVFEKEKSRYERESSSLKQRKPQCF